MVGILAGYEVPGQIAHLARKRLTVDGIHVGAHRLLDDLVRPVDHRRDAGGRHAIPADGLVAALDQLERGLVGRVVIRMN